MPTTGPLEVGTTSDHGPTYTPRTFAAEKPEPAKPAAQPLAQHTVVLQSPPLFPGINRQYIERPGRRKVKYDRNRWVILG